MYKALFVLLLGLSVMLCGCEDIKAPAWLKPGRPKTEEKAQPKKVKGTALLSVNERIVTLEDFNERVQNFNNEIRASRDIPDSVKEDYLIKTVEDKKRLLDEIAKTELLIGEAIERGLDHDEGVLKAVKALKEQLLLAKVIEAERAKIKLDSNQIGDFYEANKGAFVVPEERRVSMIVVPSESKSKELLIQLLQGADFAGLAKASSLDKSNSAGGDIGFVVKKSPFPQPEKKTMFEKFEQIAFSLELNKPSTVFKGPDGFYIIKVTEIKDARQLLLSDVYSDIEQGLTLKGQDDALKALIGNLRKVSNIIVREELLK